MECHIITICAVTEDWFCTKHIFSSLDNVIANKYYSDFTHAYRSTKLSNITLFKTYFPELSNMDESTVRSNMIQLKVGANYIDISLKYIKDYRILVTLESSSVAFS